MGEGKKHFFCPVRFVPYKTHPRTANPGGALSRRGAIRGLGGSGVVFRELCNPILSSGSIWKL